MTTSYAGHETPLSLSVPALDATPGASFATVRAVVGDLASMTTDVDADLAAALAAVPEQLRSRRGGRRARRARPGRGRRGPRAPVGGGARERAAASRPTSSVLDPNAGNVRVFNLIDLDPLFGELIAHPVADARRRRAARRGLHRVQLHRQHRPPRQRVDGRALGPRRGGARAVVGAADGQRRSGASPTSTPTTGRRCTSRAATTTARCADVPADPMAADGAVRGAGRLDHRDGGPGVAHVGQQHHRRRGPRPAVRLLHQAVPASAVELHRRARPGAAGRHVAACCATGSASTPR